MNEKDKNNVPYSDSPLEWKALGFFSAEDYLVYIFKKTEKITAALYLVSGLLKDEEPIKWELRDKGVDLLSSSFTASSSLPGDKNAVIQSIFTASLETLSLLNVARVSHLISEMNFKILVHEIDQVVRLLRDKLASNAESAGYVLSEQFFTTPDLFSTGFSKGQNMSSRTNINTHQSSAKAGISKGHPVVTEKKTNRQEVILDTLKTKSNLTIKDFAKVITDCSEKTIQRELSDLVEKGVIKKEGERRWSTYSLK